VPTPSDPTIVSGAPTDEQLDAWLASLVDGEAGIALVAVGSFGRGDRAPYSDLDLVLLHRGRPDIAAVAERIWYPIWDRGLGLDHSVRTVKQALAVADGDAKVALGLLDLRLVAGDADLAAEMAAKIRDEWRRRARTWFPALHSETVARHERYGEVAFLLEPELKEGKGGLRDVHGIRAAALASGVLGDRAERLAEPAARLAAIRRALHAHAGRAHDRLVLQEQDAVADALGFADADALMAEVSAAARAIAFAGDDGWRRVLAWLGGRSARRARRDRVLADGVVARAGEVLATDPARWLAAAAEAARHGLPVAEATLAAGARALARHAGATGAAPPAGAGGRPQDVGRRWPAGMRESFVDLLAAGPPAVAVLEALDQHGLLVGLVPEWAGVRHRPQRNAYHRFTVDRHLMEAAAQAGLLAGRVERPDLLVVAAFLHDIGKGSPGDHTDAGVALVPPIAARMGFPPADIEVLVQLVRHHLLLADVATRRDLDDPATAAGVARAVGDAATLDLLHALTWADALATGPAAWSDWKASLVTDLVERARALLEAGAAGVPAAGVPAAGAVAGAVAGARGATPPGSPLDAAGGLADGVHGHGRRCTIVAADRPGLFSKVTGVLALAGLDVRSAWAGERDDGRAVEVFDVEPSFGGEPDWARVGRDLDAVLGGRLPLEARLAERARSYASRYRVAEHVGRRPRVVVDNGASERATVIEVRAADGVGILHAITRALADLGLDVRFARISTLGHEVVDAFYVVDGQGSKLLDADQRSAVEVAVVHALDQARSA